MSRDDEPELAQAIAEAVAAHRVRRLPLPLVLAAAASVDHSATTSVGWRARVLAAVTDLERRGVVELPRTRVDRTSVPPLPSYVTRTVAPAPAKPERAETVWHAELRWVAESEQEFSAAELGFLAKVNDWLGRRTGVGLLLRERSLDIFDDDKMLETWLFSRMFDRGRLTLALLECEPCWPPVEQRVFGSGHWLVVENFTTYTTLGRKAASDGFAGRIIWGSGAQVTTRLTALAAAGERPPGCWYFGDVDAGGFRAARTAVARAEHLNFPPLQPARGLYAETIDRGASRRQRGRSRLNADTAAWVREWLGGELGATAAAIAAAGERIVQERVNSEVLMALDVAKWW